jgi:tetratricopeptide (TPR) repeat protein
MAGLLLPASLRRLLLARPDASIPEFHFEPHYKEKTPFDAALLLLKPGRDAFVNELVHDQVADILDSWSTSLRESPQNTRAFENLLSPRFRGTDWQAVHTKPLRPPTEMLSVTRLQFATQTVLERETFSNQWKASLGELTRIVTAEFQITSMEVSDAQVTTNIRAELVGTGATFHREQRVAKWMLEWERSATGYSLVRWKASEEVRSRSAKPFFADITQRAFGGNSCFESQLMYGTDYWRTVLDGASGVDIYGHHGVSVGDIDGDGLDDVYVCQPAGLPNRLFRNRGDGTFEDITESSGVGILENTACALFADFTNNDRQDLVVVRASGPLLFLNQGNGKFALKPDAFRFATPPQGTFTGAAAADYDRDGRLDIYFCLYTYYQGTDQYKYPTPYFAAENGPPNFLMHNEMNDSAGGIFRDVTAQSGLDKNNTRYSFCCGWGDANGDGWPDLYVVNDFGRKNLYRNNGDGTFRDVAANAGAEDVGAGMSVSWADYDNDGTQDLYVANMWTAAGERIAGDAEFQKMATTEIRALYRKHAVGNTLLHNDGQDRFRDATQAQMGRWAWSSDSWDFDHDGFVDIYVANGMVSGKKRDSTKDDLNSYFWRQVVAKSPNEAKPNARYEQGWNTINELIRADYSWSGFERNVMYANNHDGTFSDVSGAVAMDFLEDGRAFALSDFDRDGRLELLLKNRNAPQIRLLKNVMPGLGEAIAFRLHGTTSNHDAIGAAVTVQAAGRKQTKYVQAGSGFLSQHSKEVFFGLSEAKGTISATIRWPNGLVQELGQLPVGHRVWVWEGKPPSRMDPFQPVVVEHEASGAPRGEMPPAIVETWLLVPVAAPDFTIGEFKLSSLGGKAALLSFWASWAPGAAKQLDAFERHHEGWQREGLQLVVLNIDETSAKPIFPTLPATVDVTGTYSLLFRYLFDRHRDLEIPVSFLLDEQRRIVKLYQGPLNAAHVAQDFRSIPRTDAERLKRALPFPGVSTTYEFGRNYLSLGSIFFQRGYLEPAGDFFGAALKEDPGSAEALYGLGSVALKQQRYPEARARFEQAAKLKANYPETSANSWNNLGLIAAREGYTARAAECFEHALKIDPDHMISLVNLGSAYRQQKRWDEARRTLERAVAVKPDDAEANYGLGMVYAQADDTDRAYQRLQLALAARPDYPEALNNLGILYLRTRKRDDAVATFERCIRVAPDFDQAYLNLARLYAIEGSKEEARSTLEALLIRHPDNPVAKQILNQLQ